METSSLSVIIPVYNTGDRLRRCLDSVMGQSFTAWELILVDDGSEAPTAEICDFYAGQDTRIRVLHTANGGVSAARNRGLAMARSPWVCFIDSDDWVGAGYLQGYADRIGTGADLVLGGYVKNRGFGDREADQRAEVYPAAGKIHRSKSRKGDGRKEHRQTEYLRIHHLRARQQKVYKTR